MTFKERDDLLEAVKKVVGEKAHAFAFVALVDKAEDAPDNAAPTGMISMYHDPMFGGVLVLGAITNYKEYLKEKLTLAQNDDSDE